MTDISQKVPNLPLGAARALGDNTAGIPACAIQKDSDTVPVHKGGSNWQAGQQALDQITEDRKGIDPWVDNMGKSRY